MEDGLTLASWGTYVFFEDVFGWLSPSSMGKAGGSGRSHGVYTGLALDWENSSSTSHRVLQSALGGLLSS